MDSIVEGVQSILTETFLDLNAQGINPGGRLLVNLETWGPAAGSVNKMKRGQLVLVADSEISLVPIDMKRGEIRRWDDKAGERKLVGDARLEIARNQPDGTPLTMDLLLGIGLASDQELRARLGDELYTVTRGGVEDPVDGFSWFITLKRVES